MRRVRALWNHWRHRRRREAELEEEIAAAAAILRQEQEAAGVDPAAAKRNAAMALGGMEQLKERVRQVWAGAWLDALGRDLAYGLRQLRRNPGFTAATILVLALGIGANTAVFSVVDEVWLRPRPVPQPEQVVRVFTSDRSSGGEVARGPSTYLDYETLRRDAKSFSGISFLQMRGALLDLRGGTRLMDVAVVGDNFFDLLAPRAAVGRVFTAAQARSPGALVAMLSYPFWNDQFGANAGLPGKDIRLDGQPVSVAGVLPRGFRGSEPLDTPDAWIPMSTWSKLTGERPTAVTGWSNPSDLFARLRPGISLHRANAELAVIAARLARTHPKTNAGRRMICLHESQVQGDGVEGWSLILLAISALVLLIACANVASLMIARARHRRHEFALRAALGASRTRLLRQLLTEAALLGAAATAAAIALGGWADAVLPQLLPPIDMGSTTPIDAHLTPRVLGYCLAAGLLSVVVFGVVPAWRGSRLPLAGAIQQNERTGTVRAKARSALVAAQVALSLVLAISAGLLVRSLWNMEAANPGFNAHQNMLVLDFGADFSKPTAYRAFVDEARRRIGAIAGVLGTAVAMRVPFGLSGAGATRNVFPAGATGVAAAHGIPVGVDPVSNNFFAMLGTNLLRGRPIAAHDLRTGARVMVINQTMARRFWPHQDAVGKTIRVGAAGGTIYRVIGIAQDSVNADFMEPSEPYFYVPLGLADYGELEMVVKTASNPSIAAPAVRHALLKLDPGLTIIYFATLRQHVAGAMADERASAELVTLLGGLGLLLALVGIYGLTSYVVGGRSREIGVRMAMGATRASVLRLVMAQTLGLTATGLAAGLIVALPITGVLRAWLYGVGPLAVPVFAVVAAVLILAACCAAAGPWWRAVSTNPAETLRNE